MKQYTIYFNHEYLPSYLNPQIIVSITTPSIGLFYIKAPIQIGYQHLKDSINISFVIFGFGIIYNKNWD